MGFEHQKKYIKSLKYFFLFLNPLLLVLTLNLVAIFMFFIIPTEFMEEFAKESKYISINSLFIYFGFTFSFLLGYLFTPFSKIKIPISNSSIIINIYIIKKEIEIIAYFTFLLTIVGYLIWFRDIYSNFNLYLTILITKGAYFTRNYLLEKMIPGITTFTQFGIISAILFLLLYITFPKKRYIIFILIIVVLSIIRAIFFGERLAVLEILIPLSFIYLRFYPYKFKVFTILMFIIFILLWASELLRSYMSQEYLGKYSPMEYLLYRFIMYFATTLNNAFLLFDKFHPYIDFLPATLKPLYKLIHQPIYSESIYKRLLENHLNPEYNNKSAWGVLYFDFGYYGFVISFLIGSLSKIFYNLYKRLTLLGILVYPIFLVFLFQSYRILYLNNSRIIYVWISILVLYFLYTYKIYIYTKKSRNIKFINKL